MSTPEVARHRRECIKAGIPTGRSRAETVPLLPWPRSAEDGTPLGVDLSVRHHEVFKIMRAKFPMAPYGWEWEDYLGEVLATIARKNRMPSAHDPRKSSFGHYVWMMARNVGANMAGVSRSTRSLLVPSDDLDYPAPPVDWGMVDAMIDLERMSVRGAVGPTAAEYAAQVLRGEVTGLQAVEFKHSRARLRKEMQDEIRSAVGAVGP